MELNLNVTAIKQYLNINCVLPIRNSSTDFMEKIKNNTITQLYIPVGKLGYLKEDVQEHLFKVYVILMTCSSLCALGVYLRLSLNIWWKILAYIFMVFSLLVVIVTDEQEEGVRFVYLAIFSMFLGFLVADHIHTLFSLRPNLVLYSLLLTILNFSILSLFTFFFQNRLPLCVFCSIL